MDRVNILPCERNDCSMRRSFLFLALLPLANCSSGSLPDSNDSSLELAVEETPQPNKAFENHQKLEISAIERGKQGCIGEVLQRKGILKHVTNGKVHWTVKPISGRSYSADGVVTEFDNNHWNSNTNKKFGKYFIDEHHRLCSVFKKNEIQCNRFILFKNKITREISPFGKSPCLEVDIEEIKLR